MGKSHSWYIDKILIDSREKLRGQRAFNHYNNVYDVKIENLSFGDYLFKTNDDKKVVFEYKNCKDFISSMENKSLFQEISNQSIYYKYSYLLVEGDFDETFEYLYFNVPHYRYKYKTIHVLRNRLSSQVHGALARIYAMYIPIVFVENEQKAFDEMLKISSKIADAKKYGGVIRPSPKKFSENPVAIYLSGINGIGETKTKNIINEFKVDCLEDLMEKKPSDFLSVDKLTEKNVCDVWNKLHKDKIKLEDL